MSAPAAALKRLWMRWSLAHLLPPIVATATPHILAQASWKRELIGAVVFVVVGLTLAAAQALALRRAIPGAWRWALATIGGVALAFVATLPTLAVLDTGVRLPEEIAVPVAHGAAGATLGWAQWFVLRRHSPRARRWIVVSAVSAAALTLVWLPFFDVFWLPGHVRGLFPGSTEMTTALRVIGSYGLATGWALRGVLK